MLHGIDISSYQSETYATTGLAFVVVKRTEGTGYVNPKASAQVAHGRAHGLLIGHYHYPHIHDDPAADADYFLSHLGADLHAGDFLALDWEWYGQAGVTAAQADAFKDQWLARVEAKAPGHQTGLYSDRSNWLNVDRNSNAGDFLWIADYVTAGHPRIKARWRFHQYTDAAPQGGDGDVADFTTVAQLHDWAHAKETAMSLTDSDVQKIVDGLYKKLTETQFTAVPTELDHDGHWSLPTVLSFLVNHVHGAGREIDTIVSDLAGLDPAAVEQAFVDKIKALKLGVVD